MPAGSIAAGGPLPDAALTSAAAAQPIASSDMEAASTATGVSARGSRRASPMAAKPWNPASSSATKPLAVAAPPTAAASIRTGGSSEWSHSE